MTAAVAAVAVAGTTVLSATAAAAATPPTVPQNVTASTTEGATTVTAQWTAPADPGDSAIASYDVELLDAENGDAVLDTHTGVGAGATSDSFDETDTNPVVAGHQYKVAVQANNATDPSGYAASNNTVFAGETAPGVPTDIVATAGDQTVSVSWTPPADDGGAAITQYFVKLRKVSNNATVATKINSTDTNNTFDAGDQVVNGTAYYVTVAAENEAGRGAPAPSNNVTPQGGPSAPTNVTATSGDQSVDVTWGPPADDGGSAITGYTAQIFRQGDTNALAARSLGPSATEATFDGTDGVSNRVTYRVEVAAANNTGDGASASDTASPQPSSADEELNSFGLAGTNHNLYSRLSTQSSYGNLGGVIFDSPAFALDPDNGHTYVVVRGNNVNGNNVYIRSDAQGFVPFVTGGADCREPAAAIADGVLSVACRGTDNRLYVAHATIPPSGLPRVNGFTNYGGVLLYGPAVVASGDPQDPFIYEVVGANRHVFDRTDVNGFEADSSVPMTCFGSVSESSETNGDFIACANQAGALAGILFGPQTPVEGVAMTIPSAIVGRPGVAVNEDGTVDAYVIGTTKSVYAAGLGSDGSLTRAFHNIGGAGLGGTCAVSFSSVVGPAVQHFARPHSARG